MTRRVEDGIVSSFTYSMDEYDMYVGIGGGSNLSPIKYRTLFRFNHCTIEMYRTVTELNKYIQYKLPRISAMRAGRRPLSRAPSPSLDAAKQVR